MAIRLDKRPYVDGTGTKRWTYDLTGDHVLYVYERPVGYLDEGDKPFMLRLEHKNGRHVMTVWANTRAHAGRVATLIAEAL